jgi:hypothetical protein
MFKTTPHMFLASREAGDVNVLRELGVPVLNIYAVEKERGEFEHLFDRQEREGWRLFTQMVEAVLARHVGKGIFSVFLDYCGNLDGTAETTRQVLALLPVNSVLTITLFLGREQIETGDREAALFRFLREHTQHQVTLVQSVLYTSGDATKKWSPMGSWTFYIGPLPSRAKMRFNLSAYPFNEVQRLAASPEAVTDLWGAHLDGARGPTKKFTQRATIAGDKETIMPKKTKTQLTNIANKAVATRRTTHPGGDTERLSADSVEQTFRRRKSFSTGDIMREFKAAVGNATAVTAVLRGRKLTENAGKAPDGTTLWRWV